MKPTTIEYLGSPVRMKLASQLDLLFEALRKFTAGNDPNRFFLSQNEWQDNFRQHSAGISKLGSPVFVSGSYQPYAQSPEKLDFKKLTEGAKVSLIVDLREEEHGFVFDGKNYLGVTFRGEHQWPQVGIDEASLALGERKRLEDLAEKGEVRYLPYAQYKLKRFEEKQPYRVVAAYTEEQVIAELNSHRNAMHLSSIGYIRIPITDNMPPNPRGIDRLAQVYDKAVDEGIHFHLHCNAGEGRTTLAMVLVGIMSGKGVEEAISFEMQGKGIDIGRPDQENRFPADLRLWGAELRKAIAYEFYNYWYSGTRHQQSFESYLQQ